MKKPTDKPQTILKKLDTHPHPGILGEKASAPVRVRVADTRFLKLQGSIKVGQGSAVEDVKKARELRGTEKL